MGRTEVTNTQMLKMLNLGLEREDIVITVRERVTLPTKTTAEAQDLINLRHSDISLVDGKLRIQSGKEDYPCTGVTWYGAQVYANLLSLDQDLTPAIDTKDWSCNFSSDGFRLPTESEWEYACRAGGAGQFGSRTALTESESLSPETKVFVTNDADTLAWFGGNTSGKHTNTHRVGTKQPNAWGLFDMHGNVSEWCWDWYAPYDKSTAIQIDPSGPETGWVRTVRGGDYIRATRRIRSANREPGLPFNDLRTRGFRVVRTIPSSQEKHQ